MLESLARLLEAMNGIYLENDKNEEKREVLSLIFEAIKRELKSKSGEKEE